MKRLGLLTLLALALCGCRGPARPPHVLFVSIDTLRADHCSLYGYPRRTTPRLDAFAKQGVVFDRAYAPMATTAASHSTMFTGLLPRRHGMVKNGLILGAYHDTLAERFERRGYRTCAVVSSFVVSRRFGFDQGFASYDDEFPETGSTAKNRTFEEMEVSGGFDQRADKTTEKAAAWLAAGPAVLPVGPLLRPSRPLRAAPPLPPAVRPEGLLDDTLLVVMSDHGEGLMSHGHRNHGIHLYEEAVHVPLVPRWPSGLQGPRRVKEPVSLADLAPTLHQLAGIGDPQTAGDGTSLVPVMRGEQAADPLRPICARWATSSSVTQ